MKVVYLGEDAVFSSVGYIQYRKRMSQVNHNIKGSLLFRTPFNFLLGSLDLPLTQAEILLKIVSFCLISEGGQLAVTLEDI